MKRQRNIQQMKEYSKNPHDKKKKKTCKRIQSNDKDDLKS